MTRHGQLRTSQPRDKTVSQTAAITVGSDDIMRGGPIAATPLPLFSQEASRKKATSEKEKYLYVDKDRGIKIPKADYYFKPDGFHSPAQLRERALKQQSKMLLRAGLFEHTYAQVFVLWSGGNDSTGVTHYSMEFLQKEGQDYGVAYPPYRSTLPQAKILHVDTGTGIPETREYIESMIGEYNYPRMMWKMLIPSGPAM